MSYKNQNDTVPVVGNRTYMRHEWSIKGPCKKCGMAFPSLL